MKSLLCKFAKLLPTSGRCSAISQIRRCCFATGTAATKPAETYFTTRGSCKAAGIVGVPNVGKSTLFNALTRTQLAQVANYPFCTINPNTARVLVPDPRLDEMARLVETDKITPLSIEFVDIAGLVRGASKGQGLGNQFLANIRSVSVVLNLLRCFEDTEITHVENSVDPLRDADIISAELIISDMELLDRLSKKKNIPAPMKSAISKSLACLEKGIHARKVELNEEEWKEFRSFGLLTSKPALYCCNVSEEDAAKGNKMTEAVRERFSRDGAPVIVVSAKIESEIAMMPDEQSRTEFLTLYGLKESRLNEIIRATRQTLKQITFYTVGKPEAKAYSIPMGLKMREAAGHIHSDFEKGFIKADVISAKDFLATKNDPTKYRVEGGDYVTQDGDVVTIKFR